MNDNYVNIPLSLYIHIPWCVRKCPYCDFNSYEAKAAPIDLYIEALIADLKQDYSKSGNRSLRSIFFGGGTPSLLSPKIYEKLLTAIRHSFEFEKAMEISLEVNPGTIDKQKCLDYKAIGINRLSLGVQSFQDDKLAALGRIHDAKTAANAINYAIKAGFDNFNIDLMYGVPGQKVEDVIFDLKTALSFNVPHLSWYQLTLEPNTVFFNNPPELPDEDVIHKMKMAGLDFLKENNYQQYEVSGYCKGKQWQCKHNLNYWEFGDYLGIGVGAHGKITDLSRGPDQNGLMITRTRKKQTPDDYLAAHKLGLSMMAEEKIITEKQLPLEFMMNALRLYKAIPVALFEQRTGLNINCIANNLMEAKKQKLINYDAKRIIATTKGRDFLNNLLEIFVE